MFLTVMPALMVDSFVYLFGIPSKIIYYMCIVDILFMALLYLTTRSRVFVTSSILYVIYATIFGAGLLKGNFSLTLTNLYSGLLMCMLFDFWLKRKRLGFIKMMAFILTAYTYINLICILLYPSGMYSTSHYTQNWFLGYKNSHVIYIFAAITLRNIYALKTNGRLGNRDVFFMLISCLSLLLCDAMTGFIAVFCYVLLVIRYRSNHRSRFFESIYSIANFKTIVIVSLIANLLIVFLGQESHIANIILPLFGRSSSFTGRTTIWNVALQLIKKSPIIGYGYIQPSTFASLTGIFNGTHAHNYILHILIMGGAVCAVEHIALYWYIMKTSKAHNTLIVYCIGLTLGIYFLMGLTSINFHAVLFNCLFILFDWAIREEMQSPSSTAASSNEQSATLPSSERTLSAEKENA